MAKKFYWEYSEPEIDAESGEKTGNITTHTIVLTCSYVSGRAVVEIDGTRFDISERPFSLCGTEQVFRLGDSAALLRFGKKVPSVTVDNQELSPVIKKSQVASIFAAFLYENNSDYTDVALTLYESNKNKDQSFDLILVFIMIAYGGTTC